MRRGRRGSRLPGARGEGQRERQRDGVAEVNWRALGQSAQAEGGVGGRWEHRLWPSVSRLRRDERVSEDGETLRKSHINLPPVLLMTSKVCVRYLKVR